MKKTILLISFLILVSCGSQEAWELAPGIWILDKTRPLESLEDLSKRMPGKAIFMDRWATWCAPCLEEFEYLDGLLDFLEAHDIAMLFLNSDSGLEEEFWFEFIQEHKLQGYHARLSRDLMKDLTDRGAFIPLIPQYLIIGSEGQVIEKNALRPSDEEALYEQLSQALGIDKS